MVIVAEDHPLASKDQVILEETLPYPHIFFTKESGLRLIIDELFDRCSGKPTVVNYLAEDESVSGLVAANFGIAVVPDMEILQHLPIKKLRIISPTVNRLFYMAILKDVYEAPVVENFKKYVLDHTSSQIL